MRHWFIFAASARSAKRYHEYYEGYGAGDARARLIVSNVTLKEFQNGTPPCNAQFQDLFEIGFENAGTLRRSAMEGGDVRHVGSLTSSAVH
jgi:hypothetical protein